MGESSPFPLAAIGTFGITALALVSDSDDPSVGWFALGWIAIIWMVAVFVSEDL